MVGTTVSSTNIGTLLYSTLNGLVVNATTLVGTTVSSTNIGTLLYSTLNGLVVNATTASSTNLVVGQGTAATKHLKTTTTLDVDSIGNGSATSASVTLTGAVAGGSVYVTRGGDWSAASSTVNIFGVPSTNAVTLYFSNNSSTAVDLTNATYVVDYWAH